MLDDLKYIHDHDASDVLGTAARQYQQLDCHFETTQKLIVPDNIVYAGVANSALAGLFSQRWPTYDRPFEITSDYEVPSYVSSKTLFVAVSYSGDSEEVLAALGQAVAHKAQIIVITGGGRLATIARDNQYPLIVLPGSGLLYIVKALLIVIDQIHVSTESSMIQQFEYSAHIVQQCVQQWLPTVASKNNLAKQIALDVIGKSPVTYSGPLLSPIAQKWKTSFNENAKQVAWWSQYPAARHSEQVGWLAQPIDKPYAIIELRSHLEDSRIQEHFLHSERLLSGRRPAPIVIDVPGETLPEQLLWADALGDFVTSYTALANGLDPAPLLY